MAGHGRLHVEQRLPSDGRHAAAGRPMWRPASACGTPPVPPWPSGGVAAVLVLFPSTRSWGLLLAVPFAVLTGMAFAGPVTAWSSTRQSGDQSFPAIMRFGIIPMFLFAGAFYPIDQLPDWLQPVAYATPLYHGVELCRGAVLGTLGVAAAAVHITVLTAVLARRVPHLPGTTSIVRTTSRAPGRT